jgi:hypothetical protein
MNPVESVPPPLPSQVPPPRRLNWVAFLALLLAPGVLTSLAALADLHRDAAPSVAVIGGVLGGIGCGILLGRRIGTNVASRVIVALTLGGLCAVASITLAMFGCLLGGYELDLR